MTTPDEAIVLYHWPKTRSTIVRWMLKEVGVPYAIELVDLTKGEQNTPAYRALNQIGKVPTLRHGKTIISEVSAICCYLADRFPQAGLAPAIDHPLRGPYLKWLFFAPGCIEPAVIHKAMKWPDGPRGTIGWASYDDTIQVLADAVVNATPWLLGDKFTAADVVVGAQIRWGLQFATIPKHPAFEAYAHRLAERPALQRQIAADTTG